MASDGGLLVGLREAISGYVSAIGNYLLGRDMDMVGARSGGTVRDSRRIVGVGSAPADRRAAVAASEKARLAAAVDEARRQWVAARKFFDNVTETDLIDYAVFSIGAAEKRYMFLLDEARKQGVEVDPLTFRR